MATAACGALLFVVACETQDLGPDFVLGVATLGDAGTSDSSAPLTGVVAPLDADWFFCRVQPRVITPHRCASESNCHTSRTSLRLDPVAERIAAPACIDDHPTAPVPPSYWTNLARSRAEARSTAARSDFYVRPLGRDHPVTLYDAPDEEAALVRVWIEGGVP